MVVEAGSSMGSTKVAMGAAAQVDMAEGMEARREADMGVLLGDMRGREASEAFAALGRSIMHRECCVNR